MFGLAARTRVFGLGDMVAHIFKSEVIVLQCRNTKPPPRSIVE